MLLLNWATKNCPVGVPIEAGGKVMGVGGLVIGKMQWEHPNRKTDSCGNITKIHLSRDK